MNGWKGRSQRSGTSWEEPPIPSSSVILLLRLLWAGDTQSMELRSDRPCQSWKTEQIGHQPCLVAYRYKEVKIAFWPLALAYYKDR